MWIAAHIKDPNCVNKNIPYRSMEWKIKYYEAKKIVKEKVETLENTSDYKLLMG